MIEADKEAIKRALMEELWEDLEKYKGLPLTPELKEKLSKVRGILIPVPLSTVGVVHSPREGDPLRIEITIGLNIDCLPRLLGL